MKKVLLVEDTITLNETIKTFLELKKFKVDSAYNGKEALKLIENNRYNLYIMDINIPDLTGLDLINKIRGNYSKTPIIMMTSSIEIEPFITAFKNGCNEYIKKPFHFKELEIRIDNLLKKTKHQKRMVIHLLFKKFNIELDELIIDNHIIELRRKERKLLTILLNNIGTTVKTSELTKYIWENIEKEKYPLRQLVSTLKHKVPQLKPYIKSISGIGYKFEIGERL